MSLIEEIERLIGRLDSLGMTSEATELVSIKYEVYAIQTELQQCRDRLRWVPVSEVLPEVNQPVELINVNEWENTGSESHRRNLRDCGYLSESAGKYWSVRDGSRVLHAYTHWRLSEPPEQEEQDKCRGCGAEHKYMIAGLCIHCARDTYADRDDPPEQEEQEPSK